MRASLLFVLLAGLASAEEPALSLADLERMALAASPAIRQAEAAVRASKGLAKQAGLYPNPVIGAEGSQIAGGAIGEYGGFVEQRIVTGGKLSKSRQAASQAQLQMEASAEAEKIRVRTAIRKLYYRALGDQKLLDVQTSLVKLAKEAVKVSDELANVGQADKPDLLAAKVEAERMELSLVAARNARERTWREIAAAVNNPDLKPAPLTGDLENLPKLSLEDSLARLYGESPEIRAANAEAARAGLLVRRAEVEKIPDLQLRGGVLYNRERLDGLSSANRLSTVGVEGFFSVGVEVPLFNRYQGSVEAAKADAEAARQQVEKLRLELRKRMAGVFQEYLDASTAAQRYHSEMIPAAREAYELYLKSYRAMAAAYPQVLIAQRSLFELEAEYVNRLVAGWQASVEIEGFLLQEH